MNAMAKNIVQMHANPLMNAALAYASLGWHILPAWWIVESNGKRSCACGNADCKSPGKHPIGRLAPQGQNSATTGAEQIKNWWAMYPQANIAAYLEPSRLAAIDIDPRNGGIDTMDNLEAKHGKLESDLLQFTGGGGEHRVFQLPMGHLTMPGKLGPGVDVKLNGYIMLEPSSHISGGSYQWEASSDPRDGMLASPMPDWLRDLGRGPFGAAPFIPAVRLVDPKQVEDLRAALACIPADDYHQWVNFGNALSELGQAGFSLWDEWGQKSDKYSPASATSKWRSFKPGAIQLESIFFEAQRIGWANTGATPAMPEPVPVESVQILVEKVVEMPPGLLRLPGVLGVAADWVNATSSKPQPMFAVQAALAFGCAVLGRRFCTSQHNWPTLYLLNIGKSASGKEHAKWAVEHLLEACGMGQLIGPSSYTSGSGVLSALHSQPSHLTIIDEFGKELERASVKNETRIKEMIKTLIEAWGRCHGVLRTAGYSTMGMSAKDAEAMQQRTVRNPALSMLAMTTPDTFFDTIGSAAVRDGFLNRFLIVESDIGRQVRQTNDVSIDVPASVIEWAQAMHAMSDNVVGQMAALSPSPIVVGISGDAARLFAAFDAHCLTRMDDNDVHGLAEMYGRTNEMAMRIALLLAVGCHSGSGEIVISKSNAQWAIDYVGYHADRTVARLASAMYDSQFEATKQQVMQCLVNAGGRGRTNRELYDYCRKVRSLSKRQQIELIDSLMFVGKVQLVKTAPASGRGKPREAWVAVDPDAINADNTDKDATLTPEDANAI